MFGKMKIFATFFLFYVVAYSAALEVSQCSNMAREIEGLNDKIKVGACKRPPCRLRKNTSIDFQMKFKPEKDVSTLKNTVNAAIVGVPFPFIGVDQTDACPHIYKADGTTKASCPLKAGEEYVFKNKIDVLQIYPRIKLVVHWGLTAPEGDVICFEVPARITN